MMSRREFNIGDVADVADFADVAVDAIACILSVTYSLRHFKDSNVTCSLWCFLLFVTYVAVGVGSGVRRFVVSGGDGAAACFCLWGVVWYSTLALVVELTSEFSRQSVFVFMQQVHNDWSVAVCVCCFHSSSHCASFHHHLLLVHVC